jgi:hypothetical protein
LDHRSPHWLDRYLTIRPLLLIAACCLLVHIVLAAFTAWPNALLPNLGYAQQAALRGQSPGGWLAALRFLSDQYAPALLVLSVGAVAYVGRGGARRAGLWLLLAPSLLCWAAMVGLWLIGLTPLGWSGPS